jgi:hypothetical protein
LRLDASGPCGRSARQVRDRVTTGIGAAIRVNAA